MKILILIILCGIFNFTWQLPHPNLWSSHQTTVASTTMESKHDTCDGLERKWTFCYGDPPKRNTSDDCTLRIEPCSHGTLLGSKFIKSFTPANMRNVRAMLSNVNGPTKGASGLMKPSSFSVEVRINYPSLFNLFTQWSKVNVLSPKRDLLFMIDESGSVGSGRFVDLKRFVCATTKLLCGEQKMDLDKTRVSVMSFDSMNHLHVPLVHRSISELNTNAYFLANYVATQIKYNVTTHGNTCLNDALLFARDVALSYPMGGRRWQTNVIQEIILITDGCQNCANSKSLESTFTALKQAGIKLYVIGLGLLHKCEETLQMLEKSGHCVHLFPMKEFSDDLEDFIKVLENPPLHNGRRICVYPQYDEDKQCLPQHEM